MLRLAKYLKPYLFILLVTIVLLFVQANADLSLPDYLSKIVNTGIQQNGVENAVPLALRKAQMDRITIFLTPDEKTEVLAAYTLADQNSADYSELVKIYPVLETEPVYIRKDLTQAEIDQLNPVMARAILIVSTLQQAAADPAKAAQMGGNFGQLSQLPPGMDLFSVLKMMPADTLESIKTTINEKFDSLGSSMVIQAAIAPVRTEYEALGMDTQKLQNDYIWRVGGVMLLFTLLSAACTITVGYFSAKIASGMALAMRHDVFGKVERFSSAEFDKFSTASLITRSTNDINQVQMVVMMMVRMVIYAPIMGVGGIIRAMGKDSSMWWIIAVAVGILITMIVVVFSIALPKFRIFQSLVDRLNLVARENLSGMMVIRAFNMQPFEEERFDKANQDLTAVNLFVNRIMVIMMPMMMLIMNGLSLAIIWVGAGQVAQANMQVGDMMAFLQYAMQIVMAFLMMSMMLIMLPRASVSGDRIAEVLETELSINDPQNPETFPKTFQGVVEFNHVSFRYPGADEDVLHDISFVAQPGQTTAFIGSTGSGKSTIVNLIPRFYDVTGGAILLDGVDIRKVTQHDLRSKIGYVPQKNTLFSGTIESNLLYADKNASAEQLQYSIKVAQAAEFVAARPEGMQAEIAQGGGNVSGGQKQRMAIARALVKNPPIFIFDDSFSALDFKTDAALRKALKEHTHESTLLIVTQRISTIMNAEQIIVLEEGRMVGKGTHAELMQTCPTYREIALSQLSMEELA